MQANSSSLGRLLARKALLDREQRVAAGAKTDTRAHNDPRWVLLEALLGPKTSPLHGICSTSSPNASSSLTRPQQSGIAGIAPKVAVMQQLQVTRNAANE